MMTTQPAESQESQETKMHKYLFLNWQAVVVGVISLGFSVTSSSQQEKSASSWEYAVSLTIQVKDRTVKSGSPVWVDVTERNNSDKILALGRERPFSIDQGGGTFIVDVWNDKGIRPTETTFYRKKLGHLTPEECAVAPLPLGNGSDRFVKPSESITDRIDIGRLYDLSRPGKYTIQVRLPLESNQITITVTP